MLESGVRLKWQALRLREGDHGKLSVARLSFTADVCKAAGKAVKGSEKNGKLKFCGFAETTAGTVRNAGHAVEASPEIEPWHAHIVWDGTSPAWPIPYEPNEASEAALAEVEYYQALVPMFQLRLDPSPEADEWTGPTLGIRKSV